MCISSLLPSSSLQCLPPHIFYWFSFHNVSYCLSFISSYCMFIPSQPCFSHLLCNIYHTISSVLISSFQTRWSNEITAWCCRGVEFYLSLLIDVTISSQPCFPYLFFHQRLRTTPHLLVIFHSIISLTSTLHLFLYITCAYHLSLASLISLQCLPPHYVFWYFHNLIHLFWLHVHTVSALLPSPSLQHLPHHIFWSLHLEYLWS